MSFLAFTSPLQARRAFLGQSGLLLSGAAVALLAGRDALAADADKAKSNDVTILNTALGAELEAVAAYQVGAAGGWAWVRNPWFRYLHLAAIAFVAAEGVLGITCPLTIWEDLLRGQVRPQSFVGRWVHWALYYQAPEWVFTTAYVAWTAATLITLRFVPPRRRAR